jgi:hypothetical protein
MLLRPILAQRVDQMILLLWLTLNQIVLLLLVVRAG